MTPKPGRLRNIPGVLSPDLLHVLASLGHGNDIVLADTYFPTSSLCRHNGPREIRADGIPIPELLEAILQFLPLDTYDDHPVKVMALEPQDKAGGNPPLWIEYQRLLDQVPDAEELGSKKQLHELNRHVFYQEAKQAYAIVHTGELGKYGNIMLKAGVLGGKA